MKNFKLIFLPILIGLSLTTCKRRADSNVESIPARQDYQKAADGSRLHRLFIAQKILITAGIPKPLTTSGSEDRSGGKGCLVILHPSESADGNLMPGERYYSDGQWRLHRKTSASPNQSFYLNFWNDSSLDPKDTAPWIIKCYGADRTTAIRTFNNYFRGNWRALTFEDAQRELMEEHTAAETAINSEVPRDDPLLDPLEPGPPESLDAPPVNP
jgi:hypothetical protein